MRNKRLIRIVELVNCSYPSIDSLDGELGLVGDNTVQQGNAFFDVDYLPPDVKSLGARFPKEGLDVRVQLKNVAASSPICYGLLVRRSYSSLASQSNPFKVGMVSDIFTYSSSGPNYLGGLICGPTTMLHQYRGYNQPTE